MKLKISITALLLMWINLYAIDASDVEYIYWKWSYQSKIPHCYVKNKITITKLDNEVLNIWNNISSSKIDFHKISEKFHVFVIRIHPINKSNGIDLRNFNDKVTLYEVDKSGKGLIPLKYTGNLNKVHMLKSKNSVYGVVIFNKTINNIDMNTLTLKPIFKGWNWCQRNDSINLDFAYFPNGVHTQNRPSRYDNDANDILSMLRVAINIVRVIALKR